MQPTPDTALLLVDIQQGLASALGERNNPAAEARAGELLTAWRQAGRPVIHVQHLSVNAESRLLPELPGVDLAPEVQPLPDEPLFQKHTGCAFIGTALEEHLRERGIHRLVIAGLTTEHCVSSTARVAADLGFEVTVVSDACAAFGYAGPDGRYHSGDEIHRLALASLHEESAVIRSADDVLGV
jgi:nicotinamidase-related amidase